MTTRSPALVQIVLMLLLFAVEALNTAIKLIVDRVSPQFSIFAKRARDLGSFSVFCLLSTNAIFAGFAFIQRPRSCGEKGRFRSSTAARGLPYSH